MSHTLNYCAWKTDFHPFLSRFKGKKLFVLFSAGKDSSLALDLILKAAAEFDYEVQAHAGAFPPHRYPASEKERISAFWLTRGAAISWYESDTTDQDLRAAPNPCLPCQNVRRKLLDKILTESVEDWQRLVIVVGFSLWDIVSYSLEHVLTNIYASGPPETKHVDSRRFRETAQRFYPLIKMKEGYWIFRPLIYYNALDISTAIAREVLPTLSTPCEFTDYRPKRFLQRYYEKMSLRFDYRRVMDFATTALGLPDASALSAMTKAEYLQKFF